MRCLRPPPSMFLEQPRVDAALPHVRQHAPQQPNRSTTPHGSQIAARVSRPASTVLADRTACGTP